jgi:hypothetical protein
MSTFPKEALKEILQSLDQTNDALWTDDGSPLVSEIQRRANDTTITRGQINDALPGFARKTKDSVSEDVQPDDEGDETGGIDPGPLDASVDTIDPATDALQAGEDGFETAEDEYTRIKAIAQQRVRDAEVGLSDAKTATTEAYRAERQAEQRLTRALQQYSAKFPPISEAENIQQHIAKQQEILRARVMSAQGGVSPLNPVDVSLMDRKRNNGRNGRGPTPTGFLPRKAAVSY